MHRIDSSEAHFKNNLTISVQKTLKMNPSLEIRQMTLEKLNLTIMGQVRSIGIKLSSGSNILPLINQINFRNSENDFNQSSIEFSNNGDGFNIQLEVDKGQNHEVATFWLLDNFIYSIVSSTDICSFIVGALFDIPNKLYPDWVREHLNNNNPRREISRLFREYTPPRSVPNYIQTGRIIWNNAKHDGLHKILEIYHDSPDLGTPWSARIQSEFSLTLSQDEREIRKFCGKLLEENIRFIDSVYNHLGNRLARETLPLIL
jgi:hypothetical protein